MHQNIQTYPHIYNGNGLRRGHTYSRSFFLTKITILDRFCAVYAKTFAADFLPKPNNVV